MPRKPASNRMNCKAYCFAFRPKPSGKFGNILLCLCHRHAVTRDNDNAFGIFKRCCNTIGINRNLLAFNFHLRASRAAKPAKDNTDKGSVHRLTHDVGQDRA